LTGCAGRGSTAAPVFAALLGDSRNGRWLIAPTEADFTVTRTYQGESLFSKRLFETDEGAFAIIDFMPPYTGKWRHRRQFVADPYLSKAATRRIETQQQFHLNRYRPAAAALRQYGISDELPTVRHYRCKAHEVD